LTPQSVFPNCQASPSSPGAAFLDGKAALTIVASGYIMGNTPHRNLGHLAPDQIHYVQRFSCNCWPSVKLDAAFPSRKAAQHGRSMDHGSRKNAFEGEPAGT
jgi:hypothetical protein